ncbi:hypothetical protein [Luteolibacter sp. LG18]|uniref:hypothetical protein n=1 Tax=Luteolibacter sp. LG18 TaxID=2819286 RepID=UPI002B31F5B7|nr:hypothetical protein llg_32600 [Luteolibacter sp. LG18]
MMKRFVVMLVPLLLLASCQRESTKGTPEPAPSSKPLPDIGVPATLIGLTLKEAEELADKAKVPHRVVSIDGQSRPVTMDYRQDRLNFTVVKGIVTGVKKG